ncbi:ankyrin protein [Fusarium pseudocircinatum]|uniref:Ankyrin protein n=1 Tax=Fusarium pseudocircinatum TaxID=56676 RepID=A0A8H5KSB1_9HYPO|nr:ankyrin protein [Fusarium pseudocircinatum]
MSDPSDPNSYTVGWVCALSTEFTAAQEQFDEEYEQHESPGHREANDFNVYSFGKIKGHMVVVAVLPNGQYGTASAAAVAKDMIRSFRNIRFGLMVGIGGGAPTKDHDIRLGDVVVSSPTPEHGGVFQYDFGKATKEGFQYTASHNKPPPLLLAAVNTIISNNNRLRAKYGRPEDPDSLFAASVNHKIDPCHEFCVSTPADLISRTPRQEPLENVEVHYGTIASGNTLLKDAAKRDGLASKSNVLCFEMEAAGLMDGFRCLVIRGICDYCDSHKNDKWQGYAAMTAAVYAKQILSRIRPEAVSREEAMVSKIDKGLISGVDDLKRSIAEQEVLDWLSDEDFGAYQFDEHSKKAPGTCEWFLESPEYQSWTQEKGKVLFCSGIAGAGKSVLASAIIENLHSRFQPDSIIAIAHIYCRYSRAGRQNFTKLRASLLRQLCQRLSPLPEGIMRLYNQCKLRREKACPERILSELESVSGQFSKVFLVVDALDEWAMEHGDLYSLPAELLLLQRKLAMNLLATSRPIPLIANQFNDYPSISITAQQQDIYAYVDNFRWPESSCIGKATELQSLVKQVMSQIVRGMFLLARLYLHSLVNETSERDVKDALQRFEHRAKNNDIDPKFNIVDQAYNDTLRRLKEQHQNSSDLAFRLLAWICCTGWKLPILAVQQGLALRDGDTTFHCDGIVDEQLLVSVCYGLVEVPEGSREIRLAHFTTESFFRHNRHLIDEYFLTRHSFDCQLPSNSDAYLARQCITCLSIDLPKHDPGEIEFQTSLYDKLASPEEREELRLQHELKSNPLYEYSIFNWAGHVRRLSLLDETYKTSINFLQAHGFVDRAVMMLLTFGKWSQKRQVPQELGDLHLATLFGLGDLVESLMKNIDIDSRDSCGRTALVWALECLAFKFEYRPQSGESKTRNYDIYAGIENSYRRIIKALSRSGANLHIPGCHGDTPLHLAAILGDVEIVQYLLDHGADTHISNQDGYIPLVVAVINRKESAFMKLLEREAVDICGENSRTALMEAATIGDSALVEKLINKGAKVDHRDRDGQTALIEASRSGRTRVVELLLESQSNVDHQDHRGDTALMKAFIGDHAGVIDLLLEASPRLDIRNGAGETAFYHAGKRGREGNIKRLLCQTTDPSSRDQHSGTALISASSIQASSKIPRPCLVKVVLVGK